MDTTPGTRPTPRRLSPLIAGCLAATWLIWGSTYLAIRFALAGFPPYFLMAHSFVCAGALLMGWQMARGAVLTERHRVAQRAARWHVDARWWHGRGGLCRTDPLRQAWLLPSLP